MHMPYSCIDSRYEKRVSYRITWVSGDVMLGRSVGELSFRGVTKQLVPADVWIFITFKSWNCDTELFTRHKRITNCVWHSNQFISNITIRWIKVNNPLVVHRLYIDFTAGMDIIMICSYSYVGIEWISLIIYIFIKWFNRFNQVD